MTDAPPKAARWTWVRDVLIGVALVLAVQWWRSREVLSGTLPRQTVALSDGSSLELGAPRPRAYVLQFGASWCGVCRMEDASLRALARDTDVIEVFSQSGSGPQVAAFVAEHQLPGPVIVDADGSLARRFGVGAFPTTFFVQADGTISDVEVGYTTEWGMRARLAWAQH